MSYRGATLTWQNGRQLASYTKGDTSISYTYDADGLRTSKTVNDVKHEYYYLDGKLVYEGVGTDDVLYYYDSYGTFAGLQYFPAGSNGVMYYAATNMQGDVIGLYDASGNLVVSYEYDAWGKLLSITDTTTIGIGAINPIRYRGYYYDSETGLYYLQSRYYDPEIGRFINADGYVSTGQGIFGHNMYAYCLNNPVVYKDHSGKAAVVLLDKDGLGHIGMMMEDENGKWWHFYWGAALGWDYILCVTGLSVRSTTWCVEYTGELTLQSINESAQFSGDYEDYVFINGDFSASVEDAQKASGKYNLYTNNCSQRSFGILSSSQTAHNHNLFNASKHLLPFVAFQQFKIRTLIENGNIVNYIGEILAELFF